MRTPSDVIKQAYDPAQFVVITEKTNLQYPMSLFDGNNFHTEAIVEKGRKDAMYQVKRTSILGDNLGFGVYNKRGMTSYMYDVYAIVEGVDRRHADGSETRFQRAVQIGYAHKVQEVEDLLRDFHSKYVGLSEDEIAALTEHEMRGHDWYCAMSDAPGVWRAGETHMNTAILPLLAHLPTSRGRKLWKKHAPEGFRCPV
jgi:hypothetical protein